MVADIRHGEAGMGPGSELPPPELPAIHPSFIQVARPYMFEQTIQDCIRAMGMNPMREESLRLQGVSWIDSIRKELHLYVSIEPSPQPQEPKRNITENNDVNCIP